MYKFGFIGLGLIGGSIAKALRQTYPDSNIIAYNRTVDNIIPALQDHTINHISDSIDDNFQDCDICFLCTPIYQVSEILSQLKSFISSKSIITDVGSVKSFIHNEINKLNMSHLFIGGHPMSGSEKTGFSNSSSDILSDHVYVLTPTNEVPEDKLNFLTKIINSLGCNVIISTPTEHDKAVAEISHLPHLVSVALSNHVQKKDSIGIMQKFAGPGFIDTTRIATSSPEIWAQICASNRDNIILALEAYINDLQKINENIKQNDFESIKQLFYDAGKYRKLFKN